LCCNSGIVGKIAELAHIDGLGPLAVGPVFLIHPRVDHLAHAVGRAARTTATKISSAVRKTTMPVTPDIALLVAKRCVDLFGFGPWDPRTFSPSRLV
jgi:hypothetical protein